MVQQLHSPEIIQQSNFFLDDWTLKIISLLSQNRLRFSLLQHQLGISSKTLSKRLKELEKQGMLTKTIYAQVPLRVEYELTEKGHEFVGILDTIAKWEKKWKN